MGILDSKFPFYPMSHDTMYIQHFMITSCNFIPILSVYLYPYVLIQSPYTSLPNYLCPFFEYAQTTFVYPFVYSFLCLSTPGDLSTSQKTFYPSVTHYTSTAPSCNFSPPLPSPLLLTDQVSLPWRKQHSFGVPGSFPLSTVNTPWR